MSNPATISGGPPTQSLTVTQNAYVRELHTDSINTQVLLINGSPYTPSDITVGNGALQGPKTLSALDVLTPLRVGGLTGPAPRADANWSDVQPRITLALDSTRIYETRDEFSSAYTATSTKNTVLSVVGPPASLVGGGHRVVDEIISYPLGRLDNSDDPYDEGVLPSVEINVPAFVVDAGGVGGPFDSVEIEMEVLVYNADPNWDESTRIVRLEGVSAQYRAWRLVDIPNSPYQRATFTISMDGTIANAVASPPLEFVSRVTLLSLFGNGKNLTVVLRVLSPVFT